jgi:flagellar hook-associated protein 2
MGISSSGLISGINFDTIVTQLMTIERQPQQKLVTRQQTEQTKLVSLLDISTKLSSFKSSLDALNSTSKFNTKKVSVTKTASGDELLTATTGSSAVPGAYTVEVDQLARAGKKASQGWEDQSTTAIASGTGNFSFKVGSGGVLKSVAISATTTLQGLKDTINSSGGGVTASIINDGTGSTPYRLVLTANSSGSASEIYITQNTTSLDFANKKVEAAFAFTGNTYSGAVSSNAGDSYTGSTSKSYLLQVVAGGAPGAGSAKYKFSVDGGITWKGAGGVAYDGTNGVNVAADGTLQNIDGQADGSTTTEGVQVKFAGGALVVDDKFSIDVFNPLMQQAQDAVLKVDGNTVIKTSNIIDDIIQGVTLNLLKADTSSPATLTVSTDTTDAKQSISDFVTAYNTVMDFLQKQLSYDPATKKANPFLGDPAISEIRRKIANAVTGAVPGLGSSSYTNLSQIGISSDAKTGKLSMSSSKVAAALAADPATVAKLFTSTASATNTAVAFAGKTATTVPGTYSIWVATAPEQASLTGGQTISPGVITSDETLTFLYSSNKSNSIPTYTTASVTLSAGTTLNTIVNNLNSLFATKGLSLTASNQSGKLQIKSDSYGVDQYVKVTSSLGDVAGQVGFASDGTSEDTGVDILGMINGHATRGVGNLLTSMSGFPEAGLSVTVSTSQTGGFGTVAVSSGIADRLSASMSTYTNSLTGVLKSKGDSIQSTIDDLAVQQTKMEERITRKEESLREKFVRLESLLAQYKSMSESMTSQLASLSNMTSSQ